MLYPQNDSIYLDLYIDESGFSYLGQGRYRFFLLTALLISPDQRRLADLLMRGWRNKYLKDPNKCFHAFEFFEKKNFGYAQVKTRIPRVYKKAVTDLIEIMNHINFFSEVYYVDIRTIRKRLSAKEPPLKKEDPLIYRQLKRIYSNELKKSFGEKVQTPLTMTFKRTLEFHFNNMKAIADKDKYKRTLKGYVNIESRNESDAFFIKEFHRFGKNIYKKFGEDVIGVNFHTKGSLDGGIELADFISYIAFQTLRLKHKLHNELYNFNSTQLTLFKESRKILRTNLNIKHINISNDVI